MTEQFGAVPVRAFGDNRLSAVDFRVMGAIAYFDRLGRNHAGCYVDPHKLAEIAAIDPSHINRHTRRLHGFGYLEIGRSATDRRKRVYSLIYNEDRAVVANGGFFLAQEDARDEKYVALDEKEATVGYKQPEKEAKSNSQAVDPVEKSLPHKRLSEAYIRDPAKRRARDGEKTSCAATLKTNHARQGDRGGGKSQVQGHFLLPLKGGNQIPQNQPSEPDWNGWANWLQTDQGMTKGAAWAWLTKTLERIERERGVDSLEAGVILNRELKRRRKAAA